MVSFSFCVIFFLFFLLSYIHQHHHYSAINFICLVFSCSICLGGAYRTEISIASNFFLLGMCAFVCSIPGNTRQLLDIGSIPGLYLTEICTLFGKFRDLCMSPKDLKRANMF